MYTSIYMYMYMYMYIYHTHSVREHPSLNWGVELHHVRSKAQISTIFLSNVSRELADNNHVAYMYIHVHV